MNNKGILVLGDGLLGSELVKQTGWDYLSRKKDSCEAGVFNTWFFRLNNYHTIINCIAYTNVKDAEKTQHWNINYKFVSELVDYCNENNKKLVHISTDYVYEKSKPNASEEDIPIHGNTWYSYTKLLADAYVELKCNNWLICRGTWKPKPFPFEYGWFNQEGNFDYVDFMASLIIFLVNKKTKGLINVGSEKKSIYQLARRTKKNVKTAFVPSNYPSNVTMDLGKLNSIVNKHL